MIIYDNNSALSFSTRIERSNLWREYNISILHMDATSQRPIGSSHISANGATRNDTFDRSRYNSAFIDRTKHILAYRKQISNKNGHRKKARKRLFLIRCSDFNYPAYSHPIVWILDFVSLIVSIDQ